MQSISAKQYAAAWQEILSKSGAGQTSPVIKKLLEHLYRAGRLNLLPAIVNELENKISQSEQSAAVRVRAAQDYGKNFFEQVLRKLLPGKKVAWSLEIDKSLLSGILAETKNSRWNLNLKYKLNQLAKKITS